MPLWTFFRVLFCYVCIICTTNDALSLFPLSGWCAYDGRKVIMKNYTKLFYNFFCVCVLLSSYFLYTYMYVKAFFIVFVQIFPLNMSSHLFWVVFAVCISFFLVVLLRTLFVSVLPVEFLLVVLSVSFHPILNAAFTTDRGTLRVFILKYFQWTYTYASSICKVVNV